MNCSLNNNTTTPTNTALERSVSEIKQNYHNSAEELLLSKNNFSKPVQDRLAKIANMSLPTPV